MKTKSIFIKLLVTFLIILTLFNFISLTDSKVNYSFASSDSTESSGDNGEDRVNELAEGQSGFMSIVWGGIKYFFATIFRGIRSVNYSLASAGGATREASEGEITPFDIFFNRFTLLDANIFTTADRDGQDLDENSIVYKMRVNTSIWYYAIRALAIVVVFIMLIWNLVKSVSKSTSPGQKTIAKNALIDWVVSFALIMFMHFIIIFILNFNDLVLQVIQNFVKSANTSDFFDSLENAIFSQNFILSVATLIVYGMLNWQTFKYIFSYIQRFLTIILLVIISPIVPITYSVNRMRGGQGEALNTWLKELIYNVFVQSIHALIYAALVDVALRQLVDTTVQKTSDLGVALVAVASLMFIKYAERLVKTIFGFNNSQILNTNIFSDATNIVKNTAGAAVRGVGRAATGGPLISFGQNVDGSHIGIGQVASGIGNSLRNTGTGIKNNVVGAARAVETGVQNVGVKVKDIGTRIKEADVEEITYNAGRKVRDGATQIKEGVKSGVKGVGSRVKDGARGLYAGLLGYDEDYENYDEEDVERAHKAQLDEVVSSVSNEDNQETSKTTKTNETVEETTEITQKTKKTSETSEESEKTVANGTLTESDGLNEGDLVGSIFVPMAGGASPELLEKFKQAFKAILNDDKDTINDWIKEAQAKRDSFDGKIDKDTESRISNFIQDNWNNDKKLQEYYNGLKDGSIEKDYTKALLDLRAASQLSDESDLSKEEKIKALMDSFAKQGLEVPPEALKFTDATQVDKLQPKSEVKAEVKEPEVIDIKPGSFRRVREALLKLGVEVEDENELKTQFEAKMEEISGKFDTEEPSMQDIINGMSSHDRRIYEDYIRNRNNGNFDNSKLEGDALDAAMLYEAAQFKGLSKQAKRLGLKMTEDGEVDVRTQSAIIDLNAKRAEFMKKDA